MLLHKIFSHCSTHISLKVLIKAAQHYVKGFSIVLLYSPFMTISQTLEQRPAKVCDRFSPRLNS